MVATTLTRAAGFGPLSAAADMPSGKPIETPIAHSSDGEQHHRRVAEQDEQGDADDAQDRGDADGPNPAEPVDDRAAEHPGGGLADRERGEEQRGDRGGRPWPSVAARVSQLLAEPSPSSAPSITRPIISRRQSVQPRSQRRNRAARGSAFRGRAPARRDPSGIAAAATSAITTISAASAVNCAAADDVEGGAAGADAGADHGAGRPGRVHQRHERPAGRPLDGRALDVDHDVERADREAGHHEAQGDDRNRTSARPQPTPTIVTATAISSIAPGSARRGPTSPGSASRPAGR